MAPTLHSKFGASGAHRWVLCPGSIQLIEKVGKDDDNNIPADEGTLAHELAEALLNNPDWPPEMDTKAIPSWVIAIVKNSHRWKDEYADMFNYREMLSVALRYREFCQANINSFTTEYTEVQTAMPRIDPSAFGTNDHALVDLTQRHAIISDLKYGQGVRVAAKNNMQVLQYAEGLRQFIFDEHGIELQTFEGRIFQPRAKEGENIDVWMFDIKHVNAFVEEAAESARQAKLDDPPFNPGDKQCLFCDAKGSCVALKDFMSDRLRADFDEFDEALENNAALVEGMSDKDLAIWVDRVKPVVKWMEAIKARAHKRAMEGHTIPGHKLVAGRSGYKVDAEAIDFLLGDEAWKPRAIKSQSELKKELGTARFNTLLGGLYKETKGQPTLAPESSKAEPYVNADASEFDDL